MAYPCQPTGLLACCIASQGQLGPPPHITRPVTRHLRTLRVLAVMLAQPDAWGRFATCPITRLTFAGGCHQGVVAFIAVRAGPHVEQPGRCVWIVWAATKALEGRGSASRRQAAGVHGPTSSMPCSICAGRPSPVGAAAVLRLSRGRPTAVSGLLLQLGRLRQRLHAALQPALPDLQTMAQTPAPGGERTAPTTAAEPLSVGGVPPDTLLSAGRARGGRLSTCQAPPRRLRFGGPPSYVRPPRRSRSPTTSLVGWWGCALATLCGTGEARWRKRGLELTSQQPPLTDNNSALVRQPTAALARLERLSM